MNARTFVSRSASSDFDSKDNNNKVLDHHQNRRRSYIWLKSHLQTRWPSGYIDLSLCKQVRFTTTFTSNAAVVAIYFDGIAVGQQMPYSPSSLVTRLSGWLFGQHGDEKKFFGNVWPELTGTVLLFVMTTDLPPSQMMMAEKKERKESSTLTLLAQGVQAGVGQ